MQKEKVILLNSLQCGAVAASQHCAVGGLSRFVGKEKPYLQHMTNIHV